MIFPALPRGRDAQLSRGPDERDMERETEERNRGYDAAQERAKDEAMPMDSDWKRALAALKKGE
jgi:hypothetical protein